MVQGTVDLGSVVAAARQRSPGRGGRSPVYDLMWDNHAQLAPELNHPRRPNWPAVAQALGDQGVLDGTGQLLAATSAETVRKTWWKVSRDKAAVAAGTVRRRSKAPAAVAGQPAVPASQALPGPVMPAPQFPAFEPVEAVEVEQEPKYQFRFAGGPKKWTKEDPAPE